MDVKKMGRQVVDWIRLIWDRDRLQAVMNTIVNFRVT
jgi:hypothetical protein